MMENWVSCTISSDKELVIDVSLVLSVRVSQEGKNIYSDKTMSHLSVKKLTKRCFYIVGHR